MSPGRALVPETPVSCDTSLKTSPDGYTLPVLHYYPTTKTVKFDLTDPQRHFATAIPQRARECSTLLDAILAVSARHFSTLPEHQKLQLINAYGLAHTQVQDLNITEETVIHYHNKCITELRILADEPDAVMDENLLAAVVVLRFFEELDSMDTSPSYPLYLLRKVE